MDRFESMTVLLAVVDAGSLSAAGRKLGMPLASVSRHLSDLEARLKAQLVIRTPRQLALTDAGHAYVAACRRILDEVGEAEREVSGEYKTPSGELVVTAPIVFGRLHVVPLIADFLEAYPDVDVHLVLGDRVVSLLEEQIDLAVRIGDLPDSNLIATRVGSIRQIVCGSPAYFERHGRPLVPANLATHRSVSFDALTSSPSWRFANSTIDAAIPMRPRLVVNTAEAAIDAAIAGVGVTRVLSYQAEAALVSGKLVAVLEDFEPPSTPVSLVYANPGRLPLKLRVFIDFAVPRLRERLKSMPHDDAARSRT
jgi:DNA-binding transcriptional LysR family regulator